MKKRKKKQNDDDEMIWICDDRDMANAKDVPPLAPAVEAELNKRIAKHFGPNLEILEDADR